LVVNGGAPDTLHAQGGAQGSELRGLVDALVLRAGGEQRQPHQGARHGMGRFAAHLPEPGVVTLGPGVVTLAADAVTLAADAVTLAAGAVTLAAGAAPGARSEEHTSELQSRENLVCRL